ncbi:hypothetical protein J6590_093096 [Homalodisca vitripennis]|nr:hypothetical protein J6590_093096 [Homalodisca vitripennis]
MTSTAQVKHIQTIKMFSQNIMNYSMLLMRTVQWISGVPLFIVGNQRDSRQMFTPGRTALTVWISWHSLLPRPAPRPRLLHKTVRPRSRTMPGGQLTSAADSGTFLVPPTIISLRDQVQACLRVLSRVVFFIPRQKCGMVPKPALMARGIFFRSVLSRPQITS